MSKKTLKDGLESLFDLPAADLNEDAAYLGDKVEQKKAPARKRRTTTRKKSSSAKSSHKSFTADLESLFRTVVTETVEEEKKKKARATKLKQETRPSADKPKTLRKPTGLDALIRTTVAPNKADIQAAVSVPKDKKRVTFVFEKDKLLKLKQIAKLEKAYLKDIIGGLISEYIDEYEDGDKEGK